MADFFWLTEAQIQRILTFSPAEYGPHKTLYKCFIHWSRMGVFTRIFAG